MCLNGIGYRKCWAIFTRFLFCLPFSVLWSFNGCPPFILPCHDFLQHKTRMKEICRNSIVALRPTPNPKQPSPTWSFRSPSAIWYWWWVARVISVSVFIRKFSIFAVWFAFEFVVHFIPSIRFGWLSRFDRFGIVGLPFVVRFAHSFGFILLHNNSMSAAVSTVAAIAVAASDVCLILLLL